MADFPDYSYLFGTSSKLPEIDIYAPLKQRLTLQQLTDARLYRQAQLRHMQLQEQEAQRKIEAQNQLRSALQTLPADADAMTMLRHLGPAGLPLVKELEDARNAGLTRQTTQANLQKVQNERQANVNQRIADLGMEAVKIKDPAEREQFFNQGVASTLIDAGITPAEQFGAFRVPKDVQAAQMYYSTVKGPDKLREYLAALEKDERDALLFGPQKAKAEADAELAQRKLTGQEQTPEEQTFRNVFLPGYLASSGLQATPQNITQAYREFVKDRHPQFATPGVDVPYSPAVVAQKKELASAAAGNKPMSAEGAKVAAIASSLVPEARMLQQAIRQGGRAAIASIIAGTDPQLGRLADNVADKVGRLRSGGAVNKNEEERFMGQISRWSDLVTGTKAAEDAIDRLVEEAESVEGYMRPGQQKGSQSPGKQYQKGSDPMNLGIK